MSTFIASVVTNILEKYTQNLASKAIVVPSRRAAYFIEKEIAKALSMPTILPRVLTIDQLQSEVAQLVLADEFDLLFTLYDAYSEVVDSPDGIDVFLNWAPKLLSDFEDVDNNMVNASKIFNFLTQEKVISFWNPTYGSAGPFAESHLVFYRNMYAIYEKYTELLQQQKIGYSGFIARQAAQKTALPFGAEQLIFVGFNALTQAEEQLIDNYSKENKVSLYWDADPLLLESNLAAGRFLRKYASKHWQQQFIKNGKWLTAEKQITAIEVTGKYLMGRAAAAKAAELVGTVENPAECAIILCDDTLLMPTLSGIPESIVNFNITMGFPLEQAASWQLVRFWIELQDGFKPENGYFHSDIERLITHPLLWVSQKTANSIQEIIENIKAYNTIYITEENIKKTASVVWGAALTEAIFTPILANNLPKRFQGFLIALLQINTISHTEYILLNKLINLSNRLLDATKKYPQLLKTSLFKKFLYDWVSRATASFIGEPAKGLQIMGLLETRLLDFKKVILVGVAEGNLPKTGQKQSFITSSIRKEFDLSDNQSREALFAYYFYRLLSRTDAAWLLYPTATEGIGKVEKSRYIAQIQYDISQRYKHIVFETSNWLPKLEKPEKKITELKQALLKSEIEGFLTNDKKGVSASAIRTYQRCKLQFALHYLLKIKENEAVEESFGLNVLGNAIHQILEKWLGPFIGKMVDVQLLEKLHLPENDAKLRRLLHEAFEQQHYEAKQLTTGINYLSFEIALRYLKAFMQHEFENQSQNPSKIIGLEQHLSRTLLVENTPLNKPIIVQFKGMADRIEERNGIEVILDYKTGKMKETDLIWTEKTSFKTTSSNKEKVLQLFLYSWLYAPQQSENKPIAAGIVALRQLSQPYVWLNNNKNRPEIITTTNWNSLTEFLTSFVQELLHPLTVFDQTSDLRTCTTCNFKNMCGK